MNCKLIVHSYFFRGKQTKKLYAIDWKMLNCLYVYNIIEI